MKHKSFITPFSTPQSRLGILLFLQLGLLLGLTVISLDHLPDGIYSVGIVGITVLYLISSYFFAQGEKSKAWIISIAAYCTGLAITLKMLAGIGSTHVAAALPEGMLYREILTITSYFGGINAMLSALVCMRSWWKYLVMCIAFIPIINVIPLLIFGYKSERGGGLSILVALIFVNFPALYFMGLMLAMPGSSLYEDGGFLINPRNMIMPALLFILLNAHLSLLPNQQTIYAAFAVYAPISFFLVLWMLAA